MPHDSLWLLLAVGWVATLSAATWAAYGWDKRCARRNAWRTPESTLHALALLGGWPGALLASRQFHHKSRKLRFRLVRAACILANLALLAALIYAL